MIDKMNYICIKRIGEGTEENGVFLKEKRVQIEMEYGIVDIICTDQHIDELISGRTFTERQPLKILPSIRYKDSWVFDMADEMAKGMPLHRETWSTHSCFLYQEGKLLFACEDISRHNAVDKVIGYAIRGKIELHKCAIYSSGRVPTDMVEKAIRAGIPILVSKGAPTVDAVELARKYHLTLICSARPDQVKLFTDFRKAELDALILAGGKSSRMGGKHKGDLKIGGETFTQHLINELSGKTDRVWISYGEEIHEKYENCEIVTDQYVACGPMGGLHAGLSAARSERIFVVACDMPFVKGELIEMLENHLTEEADAVVPVVEGRVHPLAAIYRKSILPIVTEYLENGNYRMYRLVENLKTAYVKIEEQAYMMRNINTIDEYNDI